MSESQRKFMKQPLKPSADSLGDFAAEYITSDRPQHAPYPVLPTTREQNLMGVHGFLVADNVKKQLECQKRRTKKY